MNNLIDNFITTFKGEAILGYELIEDSDKAISKMLRSDKLNKDFTALLSDGVGSIIAIWNISNENQPIVYFNSDASPFAVVAVDFEEFLSSLYYGEYGVFDISNHVNHHQMKSLYEGNGLEYDGRKPEVLSDDKLSEIELKLSREYPNYDQIIAWLKENNIERNPSPYTTCVHAYTNSPDVKEYLDKQLGAL